MWQFVVGDQGRLDTELTAARNRKATFHLNGPAEASMSIDGRHEQAASITELVTDLHCLRDGLRLYRGRIGPTGDDLDPDQHETTIQTLDYRALLDRRILYDAQTFTGVDQAEILWALIAYTQALPGGDLAITRGSLPAGQPRDRTYDAGKRIGEAAQQLSEVLDGFEWEISPDLEANVWSQRGNDWGVVLDYGGLVSRVSRSVDTRDYANALRVSGDDELTAEVREATGLAARPEGRWDAQHGYTDISLQPTLSQRADWHLQTGQDLQPAYTVTFKPGAWEGPGHVWVGDTCRLIVRSGRIDVDVNLRVHTLSIDIDESGNETVGVTLGGPRPDFRRLLNSPARRLEDLERR